MLALTLSTSGGSSTRIVVTKSHSFSETVKCSLTEMSRRFGTFHYHLRVLKSNQERETIVKQTAYTARRCAPADTILQPGIITIVVTLHYSALE
jgi:hypothetical protein